MVSIGILNEPPPEPKVIEVPVVAEPEEDNTEEELKAYCIGAVTERTREPNKTWQWDGSEEDAFDPMTELSEGHQIKGDKILVTEAGSQERWEYVCNHIPEGTRFYAKTGNMLVRLNPIDDPLFHFGDE